MSRRIIPPALAAVALLAGVGCYQDDSSSSAGPNRTGPLARVFLTDAPFPYDSIASVNVHVARIEANEQPDTTGGGAWVLVTAPDRSFDLLELQQGTTAFLGEGELTGHLYRAIRVVLDADRSFILRTDGSRAPVRWPWPGSGLITMYALVQEPLFALADANSIEIVIDFDLGRSFLYNYFATGEFTVIPWLRAVHKAFTGTIAGTVTSDYAGTTQPIENASITLYAGDASLPPGTWYVVATGRSDDAGRYQVAFVSTGTYIVRIERADYPFLAPVITPNVEVAAGTTTTVSASLPAAGSGGGAYLRISGPASVGVGGTITLFAAARDASGNLVPHPAVTWRSSDTAIAAVTGVSDTAAVRGRRAGVATIYATSDGLTDSLTLQVIGALAPVATVTVVPGSATLVVGDSVGFRAALLDSAGNAVYDRPVSWFTSDSAIIRVFPFGASALVRPRATGSAVLRATSEGKTGHATITVR